MAGLTTRADMLSSIVPQAANQSLVSSMQESQTMQMQDQLSKLAPQATRQESQSAASTAAANQGQVALTAQKQNQQQAETAGKNSLATLSQQVTAGTVKSQLVLSGKSQELSNQLSQLSINANNLLVQQQTQFEKDQAGNVVWKERQLADWQALNAKDQNDFNQAQQAATNASKRKIQIMQAASDQLKMSIEQGYIGDKQIKDDLLRQKLVTDKQAVDLQIAREQARAANRNMIWTAAGTVVGGVGGTIAGGPTGGMAGAAVLGGIGSVLNNLG